MLGDRPILLVETVASGPDPCIGLGSSGIGRGAGVPSME